MSVEDKKLNLQITSFFPESWHHTLVDEFQKPYFLELQKFLYNEIQLTKPIFPNLKNLFSSFQTVSFEDVKVVILGQDPYHGKGQATGLCFAVPNETKIPPSLNNIFKEIKSEFGSRPIDTSLLGWAKQGVLLLNTILTVEEAKPLSHSGKGWEIFTDKVIQLFAKRKDPIIFLLWGAPAQKKAALIGDTHHFILKAPHPSPLSAHRGFLGCQHFSKSNQLLESLGKSKIDWIQS